MALRKGMGGADRAAKLVVDYGRRQESERGSQRSRARNNEATLNSSIDDTGNPNGARDSQLTVPAPGALEASNSSLADMLDPALQDSPRSDDSDIVDSTMKQSGSPDGRRLAHQKNHPLKWSRTKTAKKLGAGQGRAGMAGSFDRAARRESSSEDASAFGGALVRHQLQQRQEKKVWYPISRIERDFEQQDFEAKQVRTQGLLERLAADHEEYFRGKELRFDNRASFFQCIADPTRPGCYIAVQRRRRPPRSEVRGRPMTADQSSAGSDAEGGRPKLVRQEVLSLKPRAEEGQILGSNDLSLVHYADLVEGDESRPAAENLTILSFWR